MGVFFKDGSRLHTHYPDFSSWSKKNLYLRKPNSLISDHCRLAVVLFLFLAVRLWNLWILEWMFFLHSLLDRRTLRIHEQTETGVNENEIIQEEIPDVVGT